jgi:hypothetical protein
MKLTEIPLIVMMFYELLKIAFFISIPVLLLLILKEIRLKKNT